LRRFGLRKKERLRSKKTFDAIYTDGRILFSDNRKFKVLFLIEKTPSNPPVSFGIAVNKKCGTAVWRNRVKRLIRESYRLNKNKLMLTCDKKGFSLKIVFSLNNFSQRFRKNPGLEEVKEDIFELINNIDCLM